MGLLCTCPQNAAISDISVDGCEENSGQIQRLIFQRIFSATGVKNSFVQATTPPTEKANWDTITAASDSTKAVFSPMISAPTNEAGTVRTFGGGNETLNGVELNFGRTPSTFTAQLYSYRQDTIAALKTYQCESGAVSGNSNLGVFLINEFGQIGLLADDVATPANYFPIPIVAMFVGDKVLGGLENPDMNEISFKFLPNWSDKLIWVSPTDFEALTYQPA